MARDRPTFADDVKAELAGIQPARTCCQHAELRAMVQAAGAVPSEDPFAVRVNRNAVARTLVSLVKATGGRVEGMSKGATERRPSYRLRLALAPDQASGGACCARAAVRGAFLVRGAISSPGAGYHLEVALPAAAEASFKAGLARLDLPVRRLARRGRAVYYLKGAEPISRLLSAIGANRAVMGFEHNRILRDMRGQANRRTNSETANLDKRTRAAVQQAHAIHRLKSVDRTLRRLSPALRGVAELRLAHPHAGLKELAVEAQLSKSAIANRMRRLMQLSAQNGLLD